MATIGEKWKKTTINSDHVGCNNGCLVKRTNSQKNGNWTEWKYEAQVKKTKEEDNQQPHREQEERLLAGWEANTAGEEHVSRARELHGRRHSKLLSE